MQENTETPPWCILCAAASHGQQTIIIVLSHQRFWGHLHLCSLSKSLQAEFQKLITSMTLKGKTNIKGRRRISTQRWWVNIEIWVYRPSEGQRRAVVLSHALLIISLQHIQTHCAHSHSLTDTTLHFSVFSIWHFSLELPSLSHALFLPLFLCVSSFFSVCPLLPPSLHPTCPCPLVLKPSKGVAFWSNREIICGSENKGKSLLLE